MLMHVWSSFGYVLFGYTYILILRSRKKELSLYRTCSFHGKNWKGRTGRDQPQQEVHVKTSAWD